MEEERGQKKEICIEVDELGFISKVTYKNGEKIDYAPGETKKMEDTQTRLRCPNYCCWRYINGWKCSPTFC